MGINYFQWAKYSVIFHLNYLMCHPQIPINYFPSVLPITKGELLEVELKPKHWLLKVAIKLITMDIC